MSAARMRSALAPALKPLGFLTRGSNFVLRQSQLEHTVSVLAVRRLGGFFDLEHSIFDASESSVPLKNRIPLIRDRVEGCRKPYLTSWAMDVFDPKLAARQIAAIVATFSSLLDVAHFFSDRSTTLGIASASVAESSEKPKSLSEAQTTALIRGYSQSILAEDFTPASRLGGDIWVRNLEIGGFRHCVYLAANPFSTFASIMYFSFSTTDIERGRKDEDVLARLYRAPKHLLLHGGHPVLLPLTTAAPDFYQATQALLSHLNEHAPNELPRREP